MIEKAKGVLPAHAIEAMIAKGAITALREFDADQVQPASLDLRLGDLAYRVRASFLPGPQSSVAERLADLTLHEIDLGRGAVLETGCVYIVPLMERLELAPETAAATNPKSSTGRIDVFTRVITDKTREFDKICSGYKGGLYAEISPRTFPVLVRAGSRLSQIRFRHAEAVLSDAELHRLHETQILVSSGTANISGGVALSVDLSGAPGSLIGYRAKRHAGLVDVDRRGMLKVSEYWEPVSCCGGGLILDPGEFYILASREAVHVPPEYAAEMVPFDPLVGEFRVHYAGFFDPGFGHSPAGGKGSRAVLEVRSHEVPFILEHGQVIGRLVYERLTGKPERLYGTDMGSNYQKQGLKLSKHFRE